MADGDTEDLTPTTGPAPTQGQAVTTLQDVVLTVTTISNIHSPIIRITKDKLELRATKYFNLMMRRFGWVAPLTVFVPLVIASTSSTFGDFLFLKADRVKDLFFLGTLISLAWLVVAIIRAFRSAKVTDFLAACSRTED